MIPTPLWFVLFFIGSIIVAYMLFFADPGEGRVTQSMLMGGVVAVMTVLLLLLASFNHPFHSGVGGLQPTAMERSLDLINRALAATDGAVKVPCDVNGVRIGR